MIKKVIRNIFYNRNQNNHKLVESNIQENEKKSLKRSLRKYKGLRGIRKNGLRFFSSLV